MNKLELKHLTPYLPYELKISVYDCEYILEAEEDHIKEYCICIRETIDNNHKPILRPLSNLENDEYNNRIFNREYIICEGCDADLGYYEWCWLFENHFDVFGLIEKGLATNINTLK